MNLRGFLRYGPAIVLFSLVKVVALSALCGEVQFEDQVRGADVIFAGTLDRLGSIQPPWGAVGVISTRYRFGRVQYIKGAGTDSALTLVQDGGTAEGVIDLRLGRRYVIFAYKARAREIAGNYTLQTCGRSPFGNWAETPSGPQVVHMGNDGPILAIRDRYLLVSRTQSWESAHPENSYQVFERPPKRSLDEELWSADSTYAADQARQDRPGGVRLFGLWPHQDPGTRVTEDEFVGWLARVVAENSGARKAR